MLSNIVSCNRYQFPDKVGTGPDQNFHCSFSPFDFAKPYCASSLSLAKLYLNKSRKIRRTIYSYV